MKTITIGQESFEVLSIGAGFAGYGHQNVCCDFQDSNGNRHEHIILTTDTQMTDSMKDDDESIEEQAKEEASIRVIESWIERRDEQAFEASR